MTRIVHISDLHFGTEESGVLEALISGIKNHKPDMMVISGDFTQIGSHEEYRKAQDFLDTFNVPFLAVPGNHDIPRYHLMERLREPYKKYRHYISDSLFPVMEMPEMIVVGLNSARRSLPHWNWANGSISRTQLDDLGQAMKGAGEKWRVCVFHHPVQKVEDMPLDVTVFGRKRAVKTLQDFKIDLVLTGHVHHASIVTKGDSTHQTVYLSASTALSTRLRDQENGFNVIDFTSSEFDISIYKYNGHEFFKAAEYRHQKSR